MDLNDVVRSDLLILFTAAFVGIEGGGGRHVETGWALAHGVPIIVVGQPENVFHRMKVVHRGGVTIALTKLPKLKPAGYTPRQTKPFEPTGLDVGATVTWKQLVETGETYVDGDSGSLREVPIREYVERSGQVWSLAYKGVWVIPFEPLENELAVKVYKDKWSTEIRHSESQYRSRRAA